MMCGASQKCSGGGACVAATWCGTQAAPSGVLAGDYQCLDFDTGMPPAGIWVPRVEQTGVLELVIDQVRSVPNSLRSVIWAPNPELPPDIAHLTWSESGNLVSSVSLATDAYFRETYVGYPNGYADLMCVTIGGTKACLSYRYPNADVFAITFPGTGPSVPFCSVTAMVFWNQWNRIELTLANTGVATLNMSGTIMTCASGSAISSGATSVQIGAESVSPGYSAEVRLDNLISYIRR
jgi:hypothetical protein